MMETNDKGQFIKGGTPFNKGKTGLTKHTEEWKERMSKLQKKRGIKPPIRTG